MMKQNQLKTKLFMDTEFTGLHKDTTLISIGMVSECGKTFYAEFTDYDRSQIDGWLRDNVLKHCLYSDTFKDANGHEIQFNGDNIMMCSSSNAIAVQIKLWLSQFGQVEFWADTLAYDWVLFCHLFGSAFDIPENVHYIPFDIASMFRLLDGHGDTDRVAFAAAGDEIVGMPHNALYDAQITKRCYEKLILTLAMYKNSIHPHQTIFLLGN